VVPTGPWIEGWYQPARADLRDWDKLLGETHSGRFEGVASPCLASESGDTPHSRPDEWGVKLEGWSGGWGLVPPVEAAG
jgi:hypothetical protein